MSETHPLYQAAGETRHEDRGHEYSDWCDKLIQGEPKHKAKDAIKTANLLWAFAQRGGRVCIFGDDAQVTDAVVATEDKFVLEIQDMVFPICHAGQNRSQVMWHVLEKINRESGGRCMQVVKPHGAENGFDPCVTQRSCRYQYQPNDVINEDNFCLGFCHGILLHGQEGTHDETLNQAFKRAFGCEKSPRFGAATGSRKMLMPDELSPRYDLVKEDRAYMHKFFDKRFFSKTCSGMDRSLKKSQEAFACKRRVYACFMRAIKNTVARILEVNEPDPKNPADLEGLVIVGLTWADPISSNSETEQKMEEAYLAMADSYLKVLDFSGLRAQDDGLGNEADEEPDDGEPDEDELDVDEKGDENDDAKVDDDELDEEVDGLDGAPFRFVPWATTVAVVLMSICVALAFAKHGACKA